MSASSLHRESTDSLIRAVMGYGRILLNKKENLRRDYLFYMHVSESR